jgi:ribonucleoside-diphosphate reductase subunit M2
MADSPAKKLDFGETNKENNNSSVPIKIVGIPDLDDTPKIEKTELSVAATIKAEEAHEPLLQENPQRFVLFPIQHHEVCATIRHCRRARRVPDASDTVSR